MEQVSRQALVIAANRAGATLLPDSDQWINRIEIKSETSSRVYVVAQRRSSGEFGCSCMSWKTRRRCKHLTVMVPLLLAAAKSAPVVKKP